MYGLIGKMRAQAGKRDELLGILLGSTSAMPGCLSYVIARDPADADAIWISEVWDSSASHKASLQLPEVKAAISRAMPIIAGFDTSIETEPVGGFGLDSSGG
ncbi:MULTISPECIES: putative quinol monooxygenase [Aminobacter]|jgi:quinol monooxygenase YgiN|uniref:Quinol monooxygenase YgiN n=1 Tax=Aminobacter ciceronei TaxID=150723 RepID=A0ABR6CFV5_9HYPH|nr:MULTISPECIES: putative quinol monooxygenase [Aminobacter]MBA8910020.1 quinol monooxygenase YgiN [Aminobacter ciceronei]MBA9023786.1 quinol monooxygenase YgiN [Aminobacter ciceronei]BBD39218.1 antibiotic biosynthesis monooxygenase [Aminobacter sp. SS-2016]